MAIVAVAWKLAQSTGKAAWITGTSFLVLGVPLIYILMREGQMNEFEAMQQMADRASCSAPAGHDRDHSSPSSPVADR